MADDVVLNFKGLDKLMEAFKDPPHVRVGILGGKMRQPAENDPFGEHVKTNAEVGAIHEFGTDKFPVRSFLRIPIAKNLQTILKDETNAFDKETLAAVIEKGDITDWMKIVGAAAELAVSDAFDTGGDGAWIPSNMEHKKNHQTLVETAQLRRSISSEVVK